MRSGWGNSLHTNSLTRGDTPTPPSPARAGEGAQSLRGCCRAPSEAPFTHLPVDTCGRSRFARPVLDDLDNARQILLGAPLEHAVLEDEPHRLAHPHRHAEFFAL